MAENVHLHVPVPESRNAEAIFNNVFNDHLLLITDCYVPQKSRGCFGLFRKTKTNIYIYIFLLLVNQITLSKIKSSSKSLIVKVSYKCSTKTV